MLKILLQNSGSNLSVFFVKLCTTFVMAPVIIRALGNYDYGLWEVVFSIVGYMGMLDIGMRPAVVRYVAKFKAENDRASLERLFSSAFLFNGIIGLVSFCILLGWAYASPSLLHHGETNPERYFLFFLIVAIQVFIQFAGYVAECFHMGHQRYLLINNITILNTVIGNTITYFLLKNGYGLLVLAFVNACGITLKYLIYLWTMHFQRFDNYQFRFRKISLLMIKRMLVFGSKTFIQSLAGMVTETANISIIGFLLGPAMVPFYSIPAQLIGYVRRLSMTVTDVFMPMFSHLDASERQEDLKELYLVASKYIIGFAYPLMIGVSLLGKAFIARWIGVEYALRGESIIYILAGGFLILLIHPLHQRYLVGINKVAFLSKIRTVLAFFLIVNSIIMVHYLGINGAALAILLSFAVFEPLVLQYTCRQLGVPVRKYVSRVLVPVWIPSLFLFGSLWFASYNFSLESYTEIFVASAACGLLYLVLFTFITINGEERRFVLKIIPSKIQASLRKS